MKLMVLGVIASASPKARAHKTSFLDTVEGLRGRDSIYTEFFGYLPGGHLRQAVYDWGLEGEIAGIPQRNSQRLQRETHSTFFSNIDDVLKKRGYTPEYVEFFRGVMRGRDINSVKLFADPLIKDLLAMNYTPVDLGATNN